MNTSTRTLTLRRTTTVLALVASAGMLSACSEGKVQATGTDVKTNTSVSSSNSSSATPSSSSSASTPTPAWNINGKVDVAQVESPDTESACTALFGPADKAAKVLKVKSDGSPISLSSTYEWSGLVSPMSDEQNNMYNELTCSPVAVNDNTGTGGNLPSVTVSKPLKENVDRPRLAKLPEFGYGPTIVEKVGRTSLFAAGDISLYDSKGERLETSDKNTMENIEITYSSPNAENLDKTKTEAINEYRVANSKVAAVTAPLIEIGAKNIATG